MTETSAPQPVVILVRPQMGENIGAAARAMLNFGLTEMRLVDPRDGWPNPRAVAMASGAAGQVLDRARVFPTLAEAMFDVDHAYATTARGRELTKPVHTPATAMAEARGLAAEGRRVGLIFGPERAGLWAGAALWCGLSSVTPFFAWRLARLLLTPAAAALTAAVGSASPLMTLTTWPARTGVATARAAATVLNARKVTRRRRWGRAKPPMRRRVAIENGRSSRRA